MQRGSLDTDVCAQKEDYEKTHGEQVEEQSDTFEAKECQRVLASPNKFPRRNQSRRHLDHRLLASRTGRHYIPVILSHPVCDTFFVKGSRMHLKLQYKKSTAVLQKDLISSLSPVRSSPGRKPPVVLLL